jgi:hypothetical protein
MLKFVLNTLIMLSLGAILYLMARAMPRVHDGDTSGIPLKSHWLNTYLEKFDERLKRLLEKFIHQLRVWILKLDNYFSQKLKSFKKEPPKEPKLPFDEMGDKI